MSIYEEIEIEDMTYDEKEYMYYYPCPCGDKFRITLEELWDGEDVATCPSCTLRIMVIYDEDDLPELPPEDDDDDDDDDDGDNTHKEKVEGEKHDSTTTTTTANDIDKKMKSLTVQ